VIETGQSGQSWKTQEGEIAHSCTSSLPVRREVSVPACEAPDTLRMKQNGKTASTGEGEKFTAIHERVGIEPFPRLASVILRTKVSSVKKNFALRKGNNGLCSKPGKPKLRCKHAEMI
jgi:hypothetical protein